MSNQSNHGEGVRYEKITKTVTASRPGKPIQNNTVNFGYGSEEIEYDVPVHAAHASHASHDNGGREVEYTAFNHGRAVEYDDSPEYTEYDGTEAGYGEDAGYGSYAEYNDGFSFQEGESGYNDYDGSVGYEDAFAYADGSEYNDGYTYDNMEYDGYAYDDGAGYEEPPQYQRARSAKRKTRRRTGSRKQRNRANQRSRAVRNNSAAQNRQRKSAPNRQMQQEQYRYRRRRKRRSSLMPLGVCAVMLAVFFAVFQLYLGSLVYKVCRVEAGVSVSPSDFMKNGDTKAVFVGEGQSFDITKPDTYTVRVKRGLFTHKCTLIVEDTIAPKAQAVQVTVEKGDVCSAEDFVKDIQDATQVTVSYVKEPDFSKFGNQTVQVALTDEGKNRTVLDAVLVVSKVKGSVTVEVGSKPPSVQAFASTGEASFLTDVQAIDYSQVGEHEISLKVDGETYVSVLRVVDTVPPKVQVKDVESFLLYHLDPQEFALKIEDATQVTAAYKSEPDWTKTGTQKVEIVFADQGNNETVAEANLTLKQDTQKPKIQGAKDIKAFIGDSVAYRKNVTVEDNCPDCELTVDTSKVDLNTEGTYDVTYTAKDLAGNTDSVTIKLTVAKREYDLDTVNELADEILAEIIKPGMTDKEKLRAIYNYNLTHIGYVNDSEKEDYVKAAYQGFTEGRGDCFVYASAAKVLLTRAGITNMDIEKIPAATLHYWNLVDIGDGWYHFDTTPRKDHPTIFMWTDEQLMDYSEKHNKSHNYDHSLYPEVN
ncbi:MAG: hypothetical protein NC251_07205 [Lachnoclostridium sp.]|nr:hypothetical protein [Lachnospira sp.]MCM1248199.1 hypothetical protein [Lachnoclostridium sp.]MCM1534482.1 hypothetical protein [Clostridium sp.]